MIDEGPSGWAWTALEFRPQVPQEPRMLKVLNAVEDVASGQEMRWHRPGHRDPQRGTRPVVVFLMEIDARPHTVNRKLRRWLHRSAVTRVTIAADSGPIINPSGFEAMLMGGAMDGIARR